MSEKMTSQNNLNEIKSVPYDKPLTGKKITLPIMKAKNTRTGTVRGITGNVNLSVW